MRFFQHKNKNSGSSDTACTAGTNCTAGNAGTARLNINAAYEVSGLCHSWPDICGFYTIPGYLR